MYFGYQVAFGKNAEIVTKYKELSEALQAATPSQELSFAESLTRMFSVASPENIDQQLVSETMAQWKEFWTLPAIMAGAIMVAFGLFFYDKMSDDSTEETTKEAAS